MNDYIKKFKDPRWQKKRLEVFERDAWSCRECGDADTTLHVHHRYYEKDKQPWEYPLDAFLTLCEPCHTVEKEERRRAEELFLYGLKKAGFLTSDLIDLGWAFHEFEITRPISDVTMFLTWVLWPENFEKASQPYFDFLKNARKERLKKVQGK